MSILYIDSSLGWNNPRIQRIKFFVGNKTGLIV